jgi:hypothetical protein
MLAKNKAYVKHVKGPPVMSKSSMEALSSPKTALLHRENQQLRKQGIQPCAYDEYARVKAEELEQKRLQQTARQEVLQVAEDAKAETLAAYREFKAQQEMEKAQRAAAARLAENQYRKAMAVYVRQQAEEELGGLKAKKDRGE